MKDWQRVVDSPQFQEAATAAIVEMQLTQATSGDIPGAAAQAWRMEGARAFLRIFMSLADSDVKVKAKPHQNLDRP